MIFFESYSNGNGWVCAALISVILVGGLASILLWGHWVVLRVSVATRLKCKLLAQNLVPRKMSLCVTTSFLL